jgi:2-methylcitrate dehydratase PrpD
VNQNHWKGNVMDASSLFAKNLKNTEFDDLPQKVIDETKKQILDILGVAIGGFSQRGAKELRELVLEWGGKKESSVIGTSVKVPVPNAAHANATMAHCLDYDDVHEKAVMHSGVVIIPTCLAMAQFKGGLSGKDLIAAVALGVDMMCRLALATTPGKSAVELGWHLTTLFGFLGVAGVAARILGLDEEGIVNAIGIAYHQSCGNGQTVKDGALTKRLGPGFAVKGGITSALLAERGITGAHNALEGQWGLYNLYMHGDYGPDILREDLGRRFEGMNVAIKPYPCCRGIHPAIDATLAIKNENNVKKEDIKEIVIYVTEAHYALLCSPEDAKRNPRNPVDAQFSIPWGVATAIANNRVTLDDYTETAIKSDAIKEITKKMRVEIDNGLRRPDKMEPTRIEIITSEEQSFSKVVEHPLGSLERPMTLEDCSRKFRDCAKRLGNEKMDRVIEMVGRLDESSDVDELFPLLNFDE